MKNDKGVFMATLKLSGNYLNPFEQAHDTLSNNDFFNEKDWQVMANRGDLQSYIGVLNNSDKLPSFDKMNEEYRFDLMDTDLRFTAMANELYGDKTNSNTERTETVYNAETGKEETRKFNMSDYDYTKYLLNQKRDYLVQQELRQQQQERKDSMNKFWNDVGAFFAEPVLGVMDFVNDSISLVEGVVDGFTAISEGGDFLEGFRQAFNTNDDGGADWRIFDNWGWTDAIIEWESNYTDFRDLDGNYTNLGKYLGGVGYSIGQYLPSMAMNLVTAGIAGSGSKAASAMSKASMALYYTGLTAGNMKELASDPSMASVPTLRLILNSAARGAAEYGVQKALSNILGGSVLDNMVFGTSVKTAGKITATSAIKRLLLDMNHEGLEEALQELSGILINNFFTLSDQEFGKYADLNMNTLIDAYILGAISSVAGSAMSITKSAVTDLANMKSNIDPKMNFLAKWEFKRTMSQMMSDYNDVVKNDKLTLEQKQQAAGQLYANFRVISSLYGEMGQERFNKAAALLERLGGVKSLTSNTVQKFTEGIFARFEDLRKDYADKKLKEQLEKAQMSKIKQVVNRGDSIDDFDLDPQVKATLKQLLESDYSINRVILTDDGITTVQANNTLFVPIKYATNADGNVILKTRAEQDLVNNTMNASKLAPVLNTVLDLYKQASNNNTASMETALYNLFFNDSFQKIILGVANKDLYLLMAHMQDTIDAATNKSTKDSVFNKRVKDSLNALRKNLAIYLTMQQEADLTEVVRLFKDAEQVISKIKTARWGHDIYNRVVDGKATNDDITVLKSRINYMPTSQKVKDGILTKIRSDDSKIRRSGMNELDNYYRSLFISPYNGKTYLPNDNIRNNVFNSFLQGSNLTIGTITNIPDPKSDTYTLINKSKGKVDSETVLSYYRDMFKNYSNGKYDFTFVNGKLDLHELTAEQQLGYKKANGQIEDIYRGKYRPEDRTIVIAEQTGKKLLTPILSRDIDNVSRANMTVNDVIYNPKNLSQSTLADIKNKYKEVTTTTTFLYLRDRFLNATKNEVSIVITKDGSFQFVNVAPMKSVLKKGSITPADISNKGTKIQEFIDSKYLDGRAEDVVVKRGKYSEYRPDENVIYIADGTPGEMQFALLHEFQHVLQVENRLNGGLDYNWLEHSSLTYKQKHDIVNDVKKHRPELFKGVKSQDKQLKIAQQFIYNTSGESQAYGIEAMWDTNDFYPTLVKYNNDSTIIVAPWGTKYSVKSGIQSMADQKRRMMDIPAYQRINKWYASQLTDMEPNSLMGLILPDGTVGFSSDKWTHLDFLQDALKHFKSTGEDVRVEKYNGQLIEIAINGRFGKQFFDSLSIRINGGLTIEQQESLLDFIDESIMNGSNIEIEHIPTASYVKYDGANDARMMMRDLRRQINANRMSMAKQPGSHKYTDRTETTKGGRTTYKYKYEHDTYVSNKEASESNLKYFITKNKPIQMDPDLQNFVKSVNKDRIDPRVWDMIGGKDAGTLTKQKLLTYFRDAESIDRYTFSMIAKHIFKNDTIKSFDQLNKYVEEKAASFYALRGVLKAAGYNELLSNQISSETLQQIKDTVFKDKKLYKLYDEIRFRYSTYKGTPINIDEHNLRVLFMKYYDGSIQNAGYIASIAKFIAIAGYDTASSKAAVSGDSNIKNKKQDTGDSDTTILDNIEDTTATEAFSEVEEAMSVMFSKEERKTMRRAVYQAFVEQTRNKGLNLSKEAMKAAVLKMDDDRLYSAYMKLELHEVIGQNMATEQVERELKGEAKPILKPRKHALQSIYSFASTIRRNLSPNERKKFLQVYDGIFTDDLKVKRELYVGLPLEDVEYLRDELRKITADVRAGAYASKTANQIVKQLNKWKQRYSREKERRLKTEQKLSTTKEVYLGNHEFVIDSSIDIPSELKAILDTSFDTFSKTNVKYLSGEGEVHMQMNLKTFIEKNGVRLSQLTDADIEAIINYYSNAFLVGRTDEQSFKKFNAFKLYILGYLYDQGKQGTVHISAENMAKLEAMMQMVASNAGTELAVFRSVLDFIKPQRVILQSMCKSSGIEFREEDIEAVEIAAKSGDIRKIQTAMKNLYDEGLKLYKGNKKSFLDKLWKFQRIAMLSSPGSWVRNIVSNNLVSLGNDVGGILGNLFMSKHRKKGQYRITGTKVSSEIAQFVKANFVDNQLLDMAMDGMYKYDIRKLSKHTTTTAISEILINAVENKILNQNQFDTKFMNGVSKGLFKVLSDDPWIKKRTLSYLGKMLAEDGTNLSKGLSEEVLETFANAYAQAAYDYMHKQNFFTAIEKGIRDKVGATGHFIWKQVLPFAAAGWNWFVEGLNYTPIGLAKAIVDFAKLEKTITKLDTARQKGEQVPSSRFVEYMTRRRIGKGIIGTIGLFAGLAAGLLGVAGIDDDDDKLKLKFGDLYIDVTSLFGTSGLLLGIAISNPWKNKDGNWQQKLFATFTQTLDQLFMDSSFTDLYNGFRYTDSFGEWLIEQPSEMLATFIPNMLKTFNALLYNHKIKYSSGVMYGLENFVVQAIPGIAYAFPKRVDPYTGELQSKYKIPFILDLVNRMSPVKIKPYDASDVEIEAISQGVSKGELTGKYDDIGEFSNADKELLNKTYGELNYSSLKTLYSSISKYNVQNEDGTYSYLYYSQMSTKQKKSVIQRIMSDNAKIAKIYVYTSNGGKYYATTSEWQELRRLGIVNNIYKENNKNKGFK